MESDLNTKQLAVKTGSEEFMLAKELQKCKKLLLFFSFANLIISGVLFCLVSNQRDMKLIQLRGEVVSLKKNLKTLDRRFHVILKTVYQVKGKVNKLERFSSTATPLRPVFLLFSSFHSRSFLTVQLIPHFR